MGNLTREQGIVRDLGEPRPVPGHSLVVFREEVGGRIFHQKLQSGERFRPGPVERFRKSFFGYAVSEDPELRYRFSHQVRSGGFDAADDYTLHVSLLFHVEDPGVVAEKVASDPLARIRDEIESVLERQALSIPYQEVRSEAFDPGAEFLNGRGASGEEATSTTNLVRFQAFARHLGIALADVEITRRLPAGDQEVQNHTLREERQRAKNTESGKTEKQELEHEGELDARKARLRNRTRAIERATEVFDKGAEQLTSVLEHIAHNTDSARALRDTIQEFGKLRAEIESGLLAYQHSPVAPGISVLEGSVSQPLLGPAGHGEPLARELRKMAEILPGLDCRPSEIRGLAARVLHLLAELSLGQGADEAKLTAYHDDLHHYCRSIGISQAFQTTEQSDYVRRLWDLERMRKAFQDSSEADDAAEEGQRRPHDD